MSTTSAAPAPVSSVTIPAAAPAPVGQDADGVPRYAHIVVAVLENHAYSEIVDAPDAPFLTSLAASGAVLTQSYAISHPSQPNYLALFSGSTHGLSDDSCPHSYAGPNLATALISAGLTFTGYSESLPAAGFTGCSSGPYARKHNPWVDFPVLPSTVNQPMTAFPTQFSALPSISFVIPNLNDDMHAGSVADGDQWLHSHLGGYASWAAAHDSLLIVTADEDDTGHDNRIPTILTGAHVRPGLSAIRTNHYGLLRTLLASFRLPPFGQAATARPISTIWTD